MVIMMYDLRNLYVHHGCYTTIYCFCFAVKKFHGLTSFLSFPEKLSWLPVTLPILGTLDSNIYGKTCGDKAIRENSETFSQQNNSNTRYNIIYIHEIWFSK